MEQVRRVAEPQRSTCPNRPSRQKRQLHIQQEWSTKTVV